MVELLSSSFSLSKIIFDARLIESPITIHSPTSKLGNTSWKHPLKYKDEPHNNPYYGGNDIRRNFRQTINFVLLTSFPNTARMKTNLFCLE